MDVYVSRVEHGWNIFKMCQSVLPCHIHHRANLTPNWQVTIEGMHVLPVVSMCHVQLKAHTRAACLFVDTSLQSVHWVAKKLLCLTIMIVTLCTQNWQPEEEQVSGSSIPHDLPKTTYRRNSRTLKISNYYRSLFSGSHLASTDLSMSSTAQDRAQGRDLLDQFI